MLKNFFLIVIIALTLYVGGRRLVETGKCELPHQYISDAEWCDDIKKYIISHKVK